MAQALFDSEKYLEDWATTGAWPKIHDELIGLIHHTAAPDASILDLCSSVGILPQRLQDQCERRACGVEWLQSSIDSGRSYGIDVPILQSQVSDSSLSDLVEWAKSNEVTVLSARRCLSELAVPPRGPNGPPSTMEIDWGFAERLFVAMRDLGVTDIYLQGRAFSTRSVHPVPHTDAEVAWVEASKVYELHKKTKNCAWLKAS